MSESKVTSKQQTDVYNFIAENGGHAVPQGGGYWKTANGCLINVANCTQTIYSLERLGLLTRRHFKKAPYADTYDIVPREKAHWGNQKTA